MNKRIVLISQNVHIKSSSHCVTLGAFVISDLHCATESYTAISGHKIYWNQIQYQYFFVSILTVLMTSCMTSSKSGGNQVSKHSTKNIFLDTAPTEASRWVQSRFYSMVLLHNVSNCNDIVRSAWTRAAQYIELLSVFAISACATSVSQCEIFL